MEGDATVLAQARAIRNLVVNRLHYTYSVQDFFTFREDYRYVYSGVGNLTTLPLLWREREIQANMVTLDDANRNLVYLPSRATERLLQGILRTTWDDFINSVAKGEQTEIESRFGRLLQITKFEPTDLERRAVADLIKELVPRFSQNQSFARVKRLVELLQANYLPFVQYTRGADAEYTFLRHGVDVYMPTQRTSLGPTRSSARTRYSLLGLLKFLAIGRIRFDVRLPLSAFEDPPWSRTEALHVKLNIPAGLKIRSKTRGVPASLFENTKVLQHVSVEEDSLYTYVSQDDAVTILASRRRVLEEATQEIKELRDFLGSDLPPKPGRAPSLRWILTLPGRLRRAREAVQPRLRLLARMSRGMGTLLALLWLVVVLAYAARLVMLLDFNGFLNLFGALLVVVLSVAVYSIDKPYLRFPVFAHVASAVTAFIELPLFVGIRT